MEICGDGMEKCEEKDKNRAGSVSKTRVSLFVVNTHKEAIT